MSFEEITVCRMALGLMSENSIYNHHEALVQAYLMSFNVNANRAEADLKWDLERSGYEILKSARETALERFRNG